MNKIRRNPYIIHWCKKKAVIINSYNKLECNNISRKQYNNMDNNLLTILNKNDINDVKKIKKSL